MKQIWVYWVLTGSRSSFIVCKSSPFSVPEMIKQMWGRVNDRMFIFVISQRLACENPDASQTTPFEKQIVRYSIYCSFLCCCCCWCIDVSRCYTDIILWILRCVTLWWCSLSTSFRTQGQTLIRHATITSESIRFSLSLIVVGWFSLFASSVLTEFSVIPDSRSAL